MNKHIRFLIVVAFLIFLPAGLAFAAAYGTNTYTYWHWPETDTDTGYDSFTWTVTPEYEATTENGVFWAHHFYLKDGDGGYFGLQNINASVSGNKTAIFSIWEALDSESPEYASTFGGEGVGYTARISYEWKVGTTYELTVSFDGNDGTGDWWKATVKNKSTGVQDTVGRIKVFSEWGKLDSSSSMWIESYLPLNDCSELQFTGLVFGEPTANGGTVTPSSHRNILQSPTNESRTYCPGSYTVDVVGGVRHWMGASSAPSAEWGGVQEEETQEPLQISDGMLLSSRNSEDIFVIRNEKRHRIPDMATFYAKGYVLSDVREVNASVLAGIPEDFTFFPEGALIRAQGEVGVWIIKYVGGKQFKRLILSPAVFNSYGHLRWEDIMDVPAAAVDAFTTSDLVRATVAGDARVYKLYPQGDTGEKRWVTSAQVFNTQGWDWDSIYTINETDRDSYTEGAVI